MMEKAVIDMRNWRGARTAASVRAAVLAAGMSGLVGGADVWAQSGPGATPGCTITTGAAIGITKGFAEFEAFQSIRLATGNWPIETDRISRPVYACKQDGLMWRCRAEVRICRR